MKIGLTRRLEPMEHVRELGDASVPFPYDVHVLYFSDDAVHLETELHRAFVAERRVNWVNNRREFFFATPRGGSRSTSQQGRRAAPVRGCAGSHSIPPEPQVLASQPVLAPPGARPAAVVIGRSVWRDGYPGAQMMHGGQPFPPPRARLYSGEVIVVEPEGFREFVVTRSPGLLRTGLLMTGREATAKDLVQAALLKTWSKWETISPGAEKAYVRRVMVSTFLGWRRRRWHGETPVSDMPEEPGVSDVFADADNRAAVAAALALLLHGSAPSSSCVTSTTFPRPPPLTP